MTNKNITGFPMDNYYAKWVNYEPFDNNSSTSTVERFIGIGKLDTKSTNINQNLVDSNNKITRDMIATGLSSLIKSSVTSVMKSNSDGVIGIIKKADEMNKGRITTKGSASLSKKIMSNPNENPSRVINKILIIIASSLVQILENNIGNQYNNMKSLAPNMGGTINSVIKSFSNIDNKTVDKAFALGNALIKCAILSGKSRIENINFIKNTLELSDRFQTNDVEINSQLNNILDSKNFSKCVESIQTGVDFDLNNTELTDTQKNIIISSIIDCLFNQRVLMELSNNIIDSINNIIDSASKNIIDDKFQNHLYSGIVGTAVIFASFGKENSDKPQINSAKLPVMNKESSKPQTLNRYLDTNTPDNTNVPKIQNKPISQEPKISNKMLKEKNNESNECPKCVQKPCECIPIVCKECPKVPKCPEIPKCPDCNISLKKEMKNCKKQYDDYEVIIASLYNYIYILLLFVFIFGYMVFK